MKSAAPAPQGGAPALPSCQSPKAAMVEKLLDIVDDGLKFGHFAATIKVETMNGDRREVHITAGRDYRFVIQPEEIK